MTHFAFSIMETRVAQPKYLNDLPRVEYICVRGVL